jgi:dodecin
MPVIKVIELVGVSTTGWDDAARQALQEAARTVKNITGLDVQDHTAKVRDGQITEYHTTIRLAFRVESGGGDTETSGGRSPAQGAATKGSSKTAKGGGRKA